MDWIQQWQSKLNKQNGVAPLVRTGGSRHTGLAALPHRNIHPFQKMDPSRPMKQCLILEMGMPYINFKTIGDYIILICYYLKLLKVSTTEIKSFIREFEKITREYEASVNPNVSAITICHRMDIDF